MGRLRSIGILILSTLAFAALTPSQAAADVMFNLPRMNGAVVDWCETWSANCGKPGADQFCHQRGFPSAVSWQTTHPGRTYVIGSRQFCTGPGCTGFSQVLCQARVVVPPPPAGGTAYNYPRVAGAIIDWCETWATNCGKGGADRFCRARGHNVAIRWHTFQPGRTYVQGSGQICDAAYCTGFSQVVCAAHGPGPGPGAPTFRFFQPRVAGAIVDWCETWATNCGKGGADQFCRTNNYAEAVNWTVMRPGRTYVIGSRQHCEGGHCTGFGAVTCRR